jgi:uncharacterized protein (TIGR03067 family)
MSKRMATTVAIGLLMAGVGARIAGDDKADAVKMDMKLLQGDWIMQSFETNGKPIAAEQAMKIKLTIKGDRYAVDIGERKIELTFKIDPSKKPKTIDFTMAQGEEKAVTLGIYEVSADTFKVCRAVEAGKDRPSEFSTKEGSGTALASYKRAK